MKLSVGAFFSIGLLAMVIACSKVGFTGLYQIRLYVDTDQDINTKFAYQKVDELLSTIVSDCKKKPVPEEVTRNPKFRWNCPSPRYGYGYHFTLWHEDLGDGNRGNLILLYGSGSSQPFREEQWRKFFEIRKGLQRLFPDANINTRDRSIFDMVAAENILRVSEEYNVPLTENAKLRLADPEVFQRNNPLR